MDLQSPIPSSTIFLELQTVHDTGYFYSLPSLEDDWAQVTMYLRLTLLCFFQYFRLARGSGIFD